MTRGTREHEEMISQFQKDIHASEVYVTDLTRDSRDSNTPASIFFNNGKTNDLFTAYMLGYAYAKAIAQLAAAHKAEEGKG